MEVETGSTGVEPLEEVPLLGLGWVAVAELLCLRVAELLCGKASAVPI